MVLIVVYRTLILKKFLPTATSRIANLDSEL